MGSVGGLISTSSSSALRRALSSIQLAPAPDISPPFSPPFSRKWAWGLAGLRSRALSTRLPIHKEQPPHGPTSGPALPGPTCQAPGPPQARVLTPADLYLCRVEGESSWVYCDRRWRSPVVDALEILTPRPCLRAERATSAAKHARQWSAVNRERREWDRRRRLAARMQVVYSFGLLFRPDRSRCDARRYEAHLAEHFLAPVRSHAALSDAVLPDGAVLSDAESSDAESSDAESFDE